MMKRTRPARRWAACIGATVAIAACSGGGTGDEGSQESVPSTDPESNSSTLVVDEPLDDEPTGSSTTTATTTVTTSTTTTTTTTEPPVEVLPVGAVWESSRVHEVRGFSLQTVLAEVGDEVWAVGAVANAPAVWRSTDGTTWAQTIVAPPTSGIRVNLRGAVPRGEGFLTWGTELRSCEFSGDLGDGFSDVQACDVRRIAMFVSDDGVAWRRVEPPSMQVGGNTSARIDDLTAVADGYVAIGTISDRDWHSRMWFSPDGENWELITEFRGVDGPMSGNEVHWDGANLTVMTVEHPCSQDSINFNTPGWILGSGWASHIRMFSGPDVLSLTPVAPDTSPLLDPPLAVDCSLTRGFDLREVPYPSATGLVIDGTLTLLDTNFALPEDADADEDGKQAPGRFPYRLFTFDGTEWGESVTEGVDRVERTEFVALDGEPAFVQWSQGAPGTLELAIAGIDDDGVWSSVDGQRAVRGRNAESAVGFEGSILVASVAEINPFVRTSGVPVPRFVTVASSRESRADEIVECVPAAGAQCELGRFELVDGYPDLAGSDFSGAQLSFADLGDGDYTGADFSGSVLIGAQTDFDALLLGADFTGASLSGADLGDVGGANFAGAILSGATIQFSSLPEFTGAVLVDASLRFDVLPDGGFEDVVLSLPGFDLTDATISGPLLDEDPLLVIGDLTGAILEGARFDRVDLSGAVLDPGLDFSSFDVSDDSICPDGQPATGGLFGTCDRSVPPEE